MKKFSEWNEIKKSEKIGLNKEGLADLCKSYFDYNLDGLVSYSAYSKKHLIESVELSRYSVEVNYRTKKQEALEGFAKICLGYVSSALKRHGYHTKHVFTEKPLRLLVSSRNWDDGEWVGVVSWNSTEECFVISKGFYNKNKRTVSLQKSEKCSDEDAAGLAKGLHNLMSSLKDQPNRHVEKLKPVPLKRGPKK